MPAVKTAKTMLAFSFLALAACQVGAQPGSGTRAGLVDIEQTALVSGTPIPRFKADTAWPQLPENWVIGQVAGLSTDREGNIWLVHRPHSVRDPGPTRQPAPTVLRLSPDGKVLAAWDGKSTAPEIDGVNQFPASTHGVFVDAEDNVWIGGNGKDDHVVVKYSMDGKYLGQFGTRGATGGNLDKAKLGGPADIYRHNDELLIADGYINKRVITFDAKSAAFRRFWGAYASAPDAPARQGDFDQSMAASTADGGANPRSPMFGDIVHCVVKSSNGDLYVCDRRNNRIQMFRDGPDGKAVFVKDILIAPETGGLRTVSDVAFSPDETYMYVTDMENGRVWTLLRETHQIIGHFGKANGKGPAEFIWLHSMVTDRDGNIYTSEVNQGQRVQKFVFTGIE
ncbi:hypothetical protein [Sphingobium lignivorans]|uniref:Sugar lactone lactonase YvrE n=1 Tax=Sphingobium lignivorans TaxID=2735886 RepID=A0ABR6NIQ8_9SPHN|nr:hypothetical protein [Sphingobium lignivorans]MBB5987168.1 sugar lactone lactonase YvrE [Sphingobium lignivorans]